MDDKHWLDEPRNIKWLWRIFIAVLAVTVLVEVAVPMKAHFEVEAWFGFNAWFGFLACAAMIVGAKALALLLKRPDTYYGKHDD